MNRAGEPVPGTPKALPSHDDRARERDQAAELPAEPDEDVEDDFESAEELDDEAADVFDAGLLLDVEPRESLR